MNVCIFSKVIRLLLNFELLLLHSVAVQIVSVVNERTVGFIENSLHSFVQQ